MSRMDSDIVALIAAIAAIVVIPLSIAQVIQGRRKTLAVEYGSFATSLEMPMYHERLKLTWDNSELERPLYVSVRLSNVGSGDVTSAMFDRARPITVAISECKVVGVLTENSDWTLDAEASRLVHNPDLLRSRTSRGISLLVDGRPTFEWDLPLADVKTRAIDDGLPPTTANMREERTPSGRLSRVFSAAVGGFTIILVLISVFLIGSLIYRAATGQLPEPKPVPAECRPYVSGEF